LGGEVFRCPLRPNVLTFPSRFKKFLNDSDYDVVHSHVYSFSGLILRQAAKSGVKHRIAHFRTISDGKPDNPARSIYRKYMKRLIDLNANMILAVCKSAMFYGWSEDWASDKRCRVIYNGIDQSKYQFSGSGRAELLEELNIPENAKLLIHVGSFNIAKAHEVLLAAFKRVHDKDAKVHLLLAGEGVLKPEMQALSSKYQLDDCVHFLGLRDDVPRLLNASDCFVLSSRREGLPGVVLEALAAGLPVVATSLPGVLEIAEVSEHVTTVQVENETKLADALLRTLETLNENKKPILLPELFTMDSHIKQMCEVYEGSKYFLY
ncbi:MAG: glycosyltransferase, partial [Anaerohalosphaera sp.]|nr:glycosyltransferase [Anaerohalosphaera sp.]